MFSIFQKELNAFFSSLIGYVSVGVFLVVLGLFLWVFPNFNVLDNGYATLDLFFSFAPWVLLVLIPAITMRSFAEENSLGTIELLVTRPLKDMDIILGKYAACVALVVFALLPTLVYYWSIGQLGLPVDNIDKGAFWGSFIGLILLGATFVSVGIFTSSLATDQIVAFIIAAVLCSFCYLGFSFISDMPIFLGRSDEFVNSLGMESHYRSLSRGLVDTRDLIYFGSIILAFLFMTKTSLERRKW